MAISLKPLRNENDYAQALDTLEEIFDAEEGTQEADARDVLAILIEKYEEEHYSIDEPSPIGAIKFRMDQLGLTQKDLASVIGNKSKVSEILSGKRDLSLRMIRALRTHLNIPADVLIGHGERADWGKLSNISFDQYPVQEMAKNGAFVGSKLTNFKDRSEECISYLIDKIGGPKAIPAGLFRKSTSARLNANLSVPALQGWSLQVLSKAAENRFVAAFQQDNINDSFLSALVHLSIFDDGPRLARELLAKNGIALVAVHHLSKTYLDGAAFMTGDGRPVIGLTLRHDRLDNFWFTLLHEIGHVHLHLSAGSFFADDMSLRGTATDNDAESEADQFAEAALLPTDFDLVEKEDLTAADIAKYAALHSVHPAIIAGNIQYRRNDYRSFSRLLGRGTVRKLFDI